MKTIFSTILFLTLAGTVSAVDRQATRLSVNSQPSGATVVIDGQDRGTTPIVIFDLTPGRHHLKYRLAGYVESDRFVSTDDGPVIEKNEVLEPEKGLLLLKSEPAGCDIQVDGLAAGTTPRLLMNLETKESHRIRLRKAGFLDQTFQVRFEGRTPQVREVTLVRASGEVEILSEPSGAQVTVNGIDRGVTPLKVNDIPKGRATVKFHKDGFADEVREIAVNAGDSQTLSIQLNGLPGTMHLISVPDGARFYVNNEARGKGPIALTGLTPGNYLVRAELEGYGTVTKTITLETGGSVREEFRLSNVMGRLEIRTSPIHTKVVVDGRLVGLTKARDPNAELSDVFAIEDLKEGEHTITLTADGYQEIVKHPKVVNSKTLSQTFRLRRLFIPDIEIVTARGTYRGVLKANRAEYVDVEVSLGIVRSFPRDEIRKVNFLKDGK